MIVKLQLVKAWAKPPYRAHNTDAGYDLYCLLDEDYVLQPNEIKIFNTGIAMMIPVWWYGRVAPRSWLATKGIDVLAWVIDSGYLWEIKVIITNQWSEPVTISNYDKIAQIIFEQYWDAEFEIVERLDESDRWDWGFWSSWK